MMVTPDKKVFNTDEVAALLGGYHDDSYYYPIVGTVEKAPAYISKYIVESSSELKIYKRDKGIQIQVMDLLKDEVNFIFYDDQITRIVWHENQSDRSMPKFRGIVAFVCILLVFFIDAIFNKNRLLFWPLFIGLFLGILLSLFYPDSRKKMVTLLFSINDEHEVLILSGIRNSEFKAFFEEYYQDKSEYI
jgi:hypothetical protein